MAIFQGPNCMTDVNECARFLGTDLGCQNGATCRNLPGSYRYAIINNSFSTTLSNIKGVHYAFVYLRIFYETQSPFSLQKILNGKFVFSFNCNLVCQNKFFVRVILRNLAFDVRGLQLVVRIYNCSDTLYEIRLYIIPVLRQMRLLAGMVWSSLHAENIDLQYGELRGALWRARCLCHEKRSAWIHVYLRSGMISYLPFQIPFLENRKVVDEICVRKLSAGIPILIFIVLRDGRATVQARLAPRM